MLRNDRGRADDGEPARLQRVAQFQQRILIGPVAIDDDRHRRRVPALNLIHPGFEKRRQSSGKNGKSRDQTILRSQAGAFVQVQIPPRQSQTSTQLIDDLGRRLRGAEFHCD